jgi:hypothetical protein
MTPAEMMEKGGDRWKKVEKTLKRWESDKG